MFNSGLGVKIRTDKLKVVWPGSGAVGVMAAVASLKTIRFAQQNVSPWRHHQSKACERRGYCWWAECPGLDSETRKRCRRSETNMRCEECSEMAGQDVFLCNGTKGRVEGKNNKWHVCHCHEAYHQYMYDRRVSGPSNPTPMLEY